MRRTPGSAVLVAFVLGCGPGKQLPDPSLRGQSGPPAPFAPLIPPKSDDKAKAIVDAALKATSTGDVSRLEKIKAFRSSAKGYMQRPVGGQTLNLETTREFETVWPNACRVRIESQSMLPLTVGMRRPMIWMREGDKAVPFPDQRAAETNVAVDTVGHNWILFLVPLLDPRTVVFDPTSATIGDKKIHVVRAAVPGYPVFTLTFSDAHLLVQVEYAQVENGGVVNHVLAFDGHKPFGGVMLPTKVEGTHNGVVVERWTMTKWEAVEKIDDATFDPPK